MDKAQVASGEVRVAFCRVVGRFYHTLGMLELIESKEMTRLEGFYRSCLAAQGESEVSRDDSDEGEQDGLAAAAV